MMHPAFYIFYYFNLLIDVGISVIIYMVIDLNNIYFDVLDGGFIFLEGRLQYLSNCLEN